MGINYTPSMEGYSGQTPFKFWCQSVLPTEYDDSMSYYELLNRVVTIMNTAINDVDNAEKNIDALLNAYNELQGYVNHYFDNLDVQQEINNKLDALVTDGTIGGMIADVFAETYPSSSFTSTVDTWLDDNIQVLGTSPALDSTFTLANAAAQAKAVGDEIATKAILIADVTIRPGSEYTDADNLPQNKIYAVSSSVDADVIANLPVYGDGTGYLIYISPRKASTAGVQIYYTNTKYYFRTKVSSSWSAWREYNEDAVVQSSEILVNSSSQQYYDANNLEANKIYLIASSVDDDHDYIFENLPNYGAEACLIYYVARSAYKTGIQIYASNTKMFYRKVGSQGTGTWQEITTPVLFAKAVQSTSVLVTHSNASSYPDADLLNSNRTYAFASNVLSTDVAHLPVYGVNGQLTFINYTTANSAGYQLYATQDALYYRKLGFDWIELANASAMFESTPAFNIINYFVHTCVDKPINLTSGKGLYIFGDSIATTSHGGFSWGSLIATKTGCTEYNYAVGSSAFVHYAQENLRIIDQINDVSDWSHCDVAIVAAGTNDANYGTSASELRSAVGAVIQAIKTNAPNAKIIFITPIQRGQVNRNKQLPEIAGAICNVALANECSVINGFDIPIPCVSNDWIAELTDNDGLHPNSTGKKIYAQAVLQAIT